MQFWGLGTVFLIAFVEWHFYVTWESVNWGRESWGYFKRPMTFPSSKNVFGDPTFINKNFVKLVKLVQQLLTEIMKATRHFVQNRIKEREVRVGGVSEKSATPPYSIFCQYFK